MRSWSRAQTSTYRPSGDGPASPASPYLQVREARQDGVGVLLGERHQRLLQLDQQQRDLIAGGARVEARRSPLVVA